MTSLKLIILYIGALLVSCILPHSVKSQCPSGCDITITPASSLSTALTINSTTTSNQVCFNATAGDIIYTGNILLQGGGTIVICGGTNNKVYLNGSFSEGGSGARDIIVNGNLVINDADGTAGFIRSTITVNGNLTVIGKGIPTATAITGGSVLINSGGKMILDAVNNNLSGANYSIDGTLQLNGNLSTSSSSVFSNKGVLKITGNASFSGIYNNHGVWNIGQKLSLNASAGSNLTGGVFYTNDLELNSATLVADAGGCAAFVVNNFSDINSAGLSSSGDIALLDLNNPGQIDDVNTTCQAGDAAPWNTGPYCGIRPILAMSGSGSCLTTLPVVWASVTAVKINESKVKLEWVTTEEHNSASFTVQRSIDGVTFEDLNTMSASGNSTSQNYYTYTDKTAYRNLYYYRIKQSDYNNALTFSEVLSVSNTFVESDFHVFPNPTFGGGAISVIVNRIDENDNTTILLTDIRGNIVYSFENFDYKKAIELTIETKELPKGIYIITKKNNNSVLTQQLIVE